MLQFKASWVMDYKNSWRFLLNLLIVFFLFLVRNAWNQILLTWSWNAIKFRRKYWSGDKRWRIFWFAASAFGCTSTFPQGERNPREREREGERGEIIAEEAAVSSTSSSSPPSAYLFNYRSEWRRSVSSPTNKQSYLLFLLILTISLKRYVQTVLLRFS